MSRMEGSEHSHGWHDGRRIDNLDPLPGSPGRRNLAGFPNWLIVSFEEDA